MGNRRINERGEKHSEKEVTIITFSVFLMIVGLKIKMQLAAIIFLLNKPVNREKTSEENN